MQSCSHVRDGEFNGAQQHKKGPRDINNVSWATGKFFFIAHYILFFTNKLFLYIRIDTRAAVTQTGPNDARRVVWAVDMPFAFFYMRARSWTGPDLARLLWPGSAEVQVQGQTQCEPDLGGQVQVWEKCPRPGPDRTSDSLDTEGQGNGRKLVFAGPVLWTGKRLQLDRTTTKTD